MKPGKLPCVFSRIGTAIAGSAFSGIMTNSVTFEAGDMIAGHWFLRCVILQLLHWTVLLAEFTDLLLGWLLNVPDFLATADGCFPPLLKQCFVIDSTGLYVGFTTFK